MGFFLLLLLIGVPLAEIGVFIEVGGLLGLWPTLAIVVLTALAGTALLRAQGIAAFRRAQVGLARGQLPMEEMMHGFFLVIAGALLLTPGFLTDAVGFLLFVPAVRAALGRAVRRYAARQAEVHVYQTKSGFGGRGGPIIEGTLADADKNRDTDKDREEDADRPCPTAGAVDGSSPWRNR